jgi:hypothetical protein
MFPPLIPLISCARYQIAQTGLLDLLTFASGILASGIAALIYDHVTRARLCIAIDESGRVRGNTNGLHEFHHLVVQNRSAIVPFASRRPAWSTKADIEVFDAHDKPVIQGPVYARWTSQPEPLIPVVSGGAAMNVLDPAKLITGRKVDVHSHEGQQVSLLIKFQGENQCHIFSNESYPYPRWQNPAWRIPLGTFTVRATVFYERGQEIANFKLVNSGPNLDDVQLTKWS